MITADSLEQQVATAVFITEGTAETNGHIGMWRPFIG